MKFPQLLAFLLAAAPALQPARAASPFDALVAKVGREPVLLSDMRRFEDVDRVLVCAGVLKRAAALPTDRKELLDAFVEDELMYLEARSRKVSTAGLIPKAVQAIHKNEECRSQWQRLGEAYGKAYRTESRLREGESLLVRELEKRVLVEKFRSSEAIADGELWRREARARFPVKIYLE